MKQYPQYPEFLRAKREMDPCNVFSNRFSDAILFQAPQASPPEAARGLLERRRVEPARDYNPA